MGDWADPREWKKKKKDFWETIRAFFSAIVPASNSQSSNPHAKSPDEQKLQDWIRGKGSKDDFEILKEDKYHDKLMVPFEADIIVNGLQNHTDLKFNPAAIPVGFAQKMYDL